MHLCSPFPRSSWYLFSTMWQFLQYPPEVYHNISFIFVATLLSSPQQSPSHQFTNKIQKVFHMNWTGKALLNKAYWPHESYETRFRYKTLILPKVNLLKIEMMTLTRLFLPTETSWKCKKLILIGNLAIFIIILIMTISSLTQNPSKTLFWPT